MTREEQTSVRVMAEMALLYLNLVIIDSSPRTVILEKLRVIHFIRANVHYDTQLTVLYTIPVLSPVPLGGLPKMLAD